MTFSTPYGIVAQDVAVLVELHDEAHGALAVHNHHRLCEVLGRVEEVYDLVTLPTVRQRADIGPVVLGTIGNADHAKVGPPRKSHRQFQRQAGLERELRNGASAKNGGA
jgi:hypothetical protein